VSEEPFLIELGGRSWALPHLPFRIIKSIQPILFRVYAEANRQDTLGEAQIEDLANAVWRAAAFIDPTLAYDDFLNLRFSLADLFAALPAVAHAAGLRPQSATVEASPEPGKSSSTP
jgi:hypothetical protein